MNEKSPTSYIKEIDNFISSEDIDLVVGYMNANKGDSSRFRKGVEKDRWDSQCPETYDIKQHAPILNILKKSYYEFVKVSTEFYNLKETYYPYAIWMSILGPGCGLKAHRDNHKGAENIDLSGVIYLNDNFTGGELYFPELDHSYTPKSGSLVIFPSPYIHQINKVISGYRYAIPLWATKNKDGSLLRLE